MVGWSLPRKRREANWPPPWPQPRVTKAAAVGEVASSGPVKVSEAAGEIQVTWNRCWDGEVTEFYTDLCFRKTKEAKMKTKVSLAPVARNWVPS